MSNRDIKQGNKSPYIEQARDVTINYNGVEIPQALTYTPPRHEHFLDRKKELRDIYEALRSDDRPLLLVNGQGGVGKTTLATHYFREYAHEYAHTAWVTSEGNIADDLISRLQDPLGIRDQLRNIIDRDHRTQILLRALVRLQKTCLLVLDNANDPADLHSHYQLLRSCPNFHILLTTRINEFRQANFYPIKGLPLDKAIELFEQYYRKLTDTETQTLRQIHQALAANILVIELLAKNLYELNRLHTQYTLDHLLRDLREKGLLRLQSKTVHTDYGSLQHAKPEGIIAAMYDLSSLDSQERRLLSIFSVLPPENLPFEILENLINDIDDLDDYLISLHKKGWIDFNESDKTFKISPVLQEVVRKKQSKRLRKDSQVTIQRLEEKLRSYPDNTSNLIHIDYREAEVYAKFSENIVSNFDTPDYELMVLLMWLGFYFKSNGNIEKSLMYLERYAKETLWLSTENEDNEQYKSFLADSHEHLGEIHDLLGDTSKALFYYKKFNADIEGLHKKHPRNSFYMYGLAISHQKIGNIHIKQRNYGKALKSHQTFFSIIKSVYDAFCKKGVSKESDQYQKIKAALSTSYLKLGEVHLELSRVSNDIGLNTKLALGFFKMCYETKLELKATEPNNTSYLHGLVICSRKLGETHMKLNNITESLKFLEESNQISLQLNEFRPENLSFKNSLASSYSQLGKLHRDKLNDSEKAKMYFQYSYDIYKELVKDFPEYVKFQEGFNWAKNALGL